MIKEPGIDLLKNNFSKVEEKFIDYFKQGKPRWPQEKHDLLRNHYKIMDNFSAGNITLEKLSINDLPQNILQELTNAFEAFKKGEEYS